MVPSANAVEFTTSSDMQELKDTVCDMLPSLIDCSNQTIYIGSKIPSYVLTSSSIEEIEYDTYPIIGNGSIIAFANVYYNDAGAMQISCSIDFSEELQTYLNTTADSSFALIYANEGIYAVNSTKQIHCIINRDTNVQYSITNFNSATSSLPVSSISLLIHLDSIVSQQRSTQYMSLNIVRVDNTTTSCCPNGICWAAAIAMITNYHTGSSYTAFRIHEAFGCLGRGSNQASNFKSALGDLGMYTYGPYYSDLTYSDMVAMTQGDRVPFIRLASTSGGSGHAVVGKGYYWNGESTGTKGFYIVDPNTGTWLISFPSSGTIYLTLSGVSYEVDYYIPTMW